MGNNKYTDEFRRETADYVISTGRPITEVAREFRFNDKTVNDWVLKRKRSQGSTPDPKAEDCKVHRDRLHRVLLQLQEPPLNNRLQRVPADVMDEFFERFESALSESREVLRAA